MFNPEIWDTPNQSKNTHNMDQEPFTLLLPPPNITGTLHLGHLLNATIQDALARRARLQGKDGLWIPGTDHATTATQMLLEKKLQLEGRSRHDMSRAEFMAHGECWRELAGGEIITQLKGLNMSLDFERERYTMDEKYCETIKQHFIGSTIKVISIAIGR